MVAAPAADDLQPTAGFQYGNLANDRPPAQFSLGGDAVNRGMALTSALVRALREPREHELRHRRTDALPEGPFRRGIAHRSSPELGLDN